MSIFPSAYGLGYRDIAPTELTRLIRLRLSNSLTKARPTK